MNYHQQRDENEPSTHRLLPFAKILLIEIQGAGFTWSTGDLSPNARCHRSLRLSWRPGYIFPIEGRFASRFGNRMVVLADSKAVS